MANVDRGFPKLPEGYSFDEDGLGRHTAGRGSGKQRKICCDGIPIDIQKVLLKDDVSQTTKETTMLLSTKDLQAKLKISRDRAYALMRASAFPSIKLGGRYYVAENEVEDWLKRYAYKSFQL